MPRGPRLVRIASATALAASMFVVRTSFFLAFSLCRRDNCQNTEQQHRILVSHRTDTVLNAVETLQEVKGMLTPVTHLKVSFFAFRPAAGAAMVGAFPPRPVDQADHTLADRSFS